MFYRWDGNDLLLNVKLQPKAAKDCIAGVSGEYLKIKITSPPIDGKANLHLIRWLCKLFKVPQSRITILSGETARIKCLRISVPGNIPDFI